MACSMSTAARHAAKLFPGRVAVVVGGTSGIGSGIAMRLAQANVGVTIVGRSAERGQEIVKKMSELSTNPDVRHEFMACDAMLLSSVADCAAQYARAHPKLDFLVLTQGIATTQGRTETKEGLDQKMVLHYYSRVAFIQNLLPLLKQAEDPRVLSVFSAGVHSEHKGFEDDLDLKNNYTLQNAANICGMYNDLAFDALARENPTVSFVHSAPGAVDTEWGREMPWYLRGPIRVLQVFFRSVKTCAEYMSCALFDDQYKAGFHLMNPDGQKIAPQAWHTDQAREIAWRHTQSVLQQYIRAHPEQAVQAEEQKQD
eukprot:TRINITY_DN1624_c0_g1_i1.p1 TRINITY_DN1624_c0_g1~~TRINITY_DN1624_c0_g1_i1.p1  ORF type:complete len:337 (-),score=110.01 TRINITY_DN1624_c0_g1_i1:100-1038(-)